MGISPPTSSDAFSPDEQLLYVSDTSGALPGQGSNHCLWVFDVARGRLLYEELVAHGRDQGIRAWLGGFPGRLGGRLRDERGRRENEESREAPGRHHVSTLPSSRYSISAFCTCRRFSASSHTTD